MPLQVSLKQMFSNRAKGPTSFVSKKSREFSTQVVQISGGTWGQFLCSLVPEDFLLLEVLKARTSGEEKPNMREPLGAHVRFFECADPIRSRL